MILGDGGHTAALAGQRESAFLLVSVSETLKLAVVVADLVVGALAAVQRLLETVGHRPDIFLAVGLDVVRSVVAGRDDLDSDVIVAALAADPGEGPGQARGSVAKRCLAGSGQFDARDSHGISPCYRLRYRHMKPWNRNHIKVINCFFRKNLQISPSS